jgi:mono/diheme cytochrome c family protein
MRRRLWWILSVFGVGVIALFAFVRGTGISAIRQPFPGEDRIAKAAWRFLIPGDIRAAINPVANTTEVLQDGLEHFADHCAVCHANNGSGDTMVGRRVFPPSPDLRGPRTQGLTDGELFYAIENGIPWTAMPAWRNGTPEGVESSWALVRFIRHLPALTPEELSQMERFNPKSPADLERDRAIDEFLRGGATPPKVTTTGHTHK